MSHTVSPNAGTRARRRPMALLIAVALALLVLVPSGAAQAEDSGSSSLPPGASWVRVGHFVPGMGTTSVEVTPLGGSGKSLMLARAAKYSQVSAYDKLAPGRYTATVRETSAAADAEPLLSRSFEISAGEARTVAVVGTSSQPRLVLLADDLTPPTKGTARVRLLSASKAADTVTVKAVGGPTIADDAVLGQVTGYVTVPAGSWNLQLSSSSASATEQRVPIASGSVYTVVALDSGSDRVALRVVTDAAGAVVRPRGGAKTGGGGMAALVEGRSTTGSGGASSPALLGLVLTAGAAFGVLRLRRRTRAAR